MEYAKLKEKLLAHIDFLKEEAIATSHFIHANPEIGGEEYKASERLVAELKKHGFSVAYPIGGMETAFKSRLKGQESGPRIAFLAAASAGHHRPAAFPLSLLSCPLRQ